ncbi:hypothetical protein INT48_006722 [Thamnidium elegans]|uniref:HCP-like protein n=1 Tax=Thamnidium elegans TaxID=101142 RepID=A0A8H7SRA5_9FUNG|nr:hypothetical protein INT48_006722 [Thamnidium elegans]
MKITYNIYGYMHTSDKSLFRGIDFMNNGDYQNAIKYFEESAKYNNEYAQLLCASIYYMGFAVKRNPKRAIYLFKKTAIAWGNRVAQYYVGIMYRDGDGVKQNNESSIHWLTLSANHGWCDAQVNLGYMYQNGIYAKKDYNKALYYYKKALQMKKESTDEMYLFGNKEFKINYDSKELFLYQLSETINKMNGCPSPLHTAKSYDQQFPTKQKFYEINFWYTICKEQQHHVLVRSFIGELYFYGHGNFKKDHSKAKIWFEKAAKNGSANGQLFMGSLYQYQENYKQALVWYTMASKNGSQEALFKLAEYYYHIEKDYIKAKYYCELVLDRTEGHGQAYNMMGDIYSNGNQEIKLNNDKAIHYYSKAMDYGCHKGATRITLLCQKTKLGMFKRRK